MKKMRMKILTSIILILVVTLIFTKNDLVSFFISITDATIEEEIFIEINYGQKHTSNHLVVMQISDITDRDVKSVKVQFSTDEVNWLGYNPSSGWVLNYAGAYQTFYSDFSIGTISGLKTIHFRMLDGENNILETSLAKIYYLPDGTHPTIIPPPSSQFGSGTEYEPFFTAKQNVLLNLSTVNGQQFSYSLDGVTWSKWQNIKNNIIEKQVLIANNEGILQTVQVKVRNAFSIESSVYTVYFILDRTAPKLEILSWNNYVATYDGVVLVPLAVFDYYSDIIYFEITLKKEGLVERLSTKIDIIIKNSTIYNDIKLSNLGKGIYVVTIYAKDRAGNYTRLITRINKL
ncbi:hypothetical protein JYU21_02305 [Alkaliphilus sp. AH-315-G20]|nr:hypothetical protein [Alkaliphilus sp. AH-315-G20]